MIYLSDILANKYDSFDRSLKRKLKEHDAEFQIINDCKDIWIRDFFPTKTKQGWQAFRYYPDYLKGFPGERTDISALDLPIKYDNSTLVVDGGNIVMSLDKSVALMCDKIFEENPKINRADLVNQLKEALQADILFIPFHKEDKIGHADGYVRWIDNESILVAEDSLEDNQMHQLKEVLKNYKLEYFCNYVTDKKNKDGIPSAEGCYINYLETDGLVLVPQFGHEKDALALKQLKAIFPHKVVDGIDCTDIAIDGGVLNCITGG